MRNWRKHIVILVVYTFITLAMTYPLILHFDTAIPGVEGDAPSFVWAMGWMKTALERGLNPFRSDFVFYPLGGATQLMWATSLIALVSIPFQSLLGLIATHNLFYLAATVLTAWGTYLLAENILRNSKSQLSNLKFDSTPLPPFQTLLLVQFITEQRRLAARVSPLACFIAGIVFAFAPLRLGYGLAFFNLYNTQLIPFYILFLLRASRTQSRRNAIVAGILLGLNAYLDFQIAAFLILFTGWHILFNGFTRLQTNATSSRERFLLLFKETLVPMSLVGVVALLIVAPMLAVLANDFAAEGGNYIRVFPLKYSTDRSYDLLAYAVPNAWSSLYSIVPKIPGINTGINANDGSALSPDRQAFVGYVVFVLALCATITQWWRTRFWALAAILFALFSWGPSLHVLGQDLNVPMPYRLLHAIPILNHIRIPMRYGMMVMLALAMLAAFAVNELARRFTTHPTSFVFRFAFLLLPLFILVEYANVQYPLQPLTIPRVYHTIAQQPGDFTILEVPSFNWRYAAATEVHQAIHGKRILRAYTNRIAPSLAEYVGLRGTPIVVRSLRILEGIEPGVLTPEEIAEDKSARDEIVHFFDLRYVVVHRDLLKPDQSSKIETYLREVLGAWQVAVDGEVVLYEIPRANQTSDSIKIDLRENIGQMFAGRGWQFEYPPANYDGKFNFVYTRGVASEIYFVLDHPAERTLTLNAFANPPQRVEVFLNDAHIGTLNLNETWSDHRVPLPARALNAGMNCIELRYDAELYETIGVTMITIQ